MSRLRIQRHDDTGTALLKRQRKAMPKRERRSRLGDVL